MAAISMQKQSSRNLVLSPKVQTTYGTALIDTALTIRQRFDPSTAFMPTPAFRTDKTMAGKGSEWATDSEITEWDTAGTLKIDADSLGMGWMLAMIFGQETDTGSASVYTHAYSVPAITATMPATTIYTEDTAAIKRHFLDMAASSLSITVPERGAIQASLDMVGTGLYNNTAFTGALPALVAANYLLGSDFLATITPSGGAATPFSGRQKSLSIKLDRGSSAFKASGDGLTAGSVASGTGKFSVDLTIAALVTDDVNGWFQNNTQLSISLATNPTLTYQMGFNFPAAYVKANKLGNVEDKVMWQLSFDETTCIASGATAAISAFNIDAQAAWLVAG
jgi:hypothetical protein